MTMIGATHFHTIFVDDVSAATLDNAVRRNDLQLVFLAFSKGHIRNYRLVVTGLMVVVLSLLRAVSLESLYRIVCHCHDACTRIPGKMRLRKI